MALRDSVLNLLVAYAAGPRPIQTQLCVCLASLAIQMLEWKDVLVTVGSALGSSAGDCVLEFLKILPEEVTEGRKINLSVCSVNCNLTKRPPPPICGSRSGQQDQSNVLSSHRKRTLSREQRSCWKITQIR